MPFEDWPTRRLGDVVELKRGYDLPTRARVPGPYPIISSSGESGWHNEAKAKGPGVVTGRYGTIGKVFFVECDFWPLNTALYARDFRGNDERFIYYLLHTLNFGAYTDKAAVPGINRNHLHMEEVKVPPIDEQRRIAAVLGALDDRIEVNRRMNRTLEAMAQALFRSRFVGFDGRDDLVETEAGPIPSGWRWGTFGEVARQHSDTVHPDDVDPDTLHIGLSDMPPGSIALDSWGTAADVSSGKARFDRGDILFGKLRPYFKKVGVAPRDGICSSDILVVRPKTQAWYGLTLGLLTYDPFIDFTEKVSTGTRMPRVSWKAMAGYEMALPPEEEAAAFDAFIRPTVGRILANIEHSRTLAALRDALLPKLVSGEIRVPEAEEAAEAVL